MSLQTDQAHQEQQRQLVERDRINSTAHQQPYGGEPAKGKLLSICHKAEPIGGCFKTNGHRYGTCSKCGDEMALFAEYDKDGVIIQ